MSKDKEILAFGSCKDFPMQLYGRIIIACVAEAPSRTLVNWILPY